MTNNTEVIKTLEEENNKKRNDFIKKYGHSANAATGSKYDSNANVISLNVATLAGELYKGETISLNRHRMKEKLEFLYGNDLNYIDKLKSHLIYKHDETSLQPYCVAVSMYPFLTEGLSSLSGISEPPKNLRSFCGSFVNLIFILSSQFAGAIATPEFLTYFDHFARLNFGNDYMDKLDEVLYVSEIKPVTIRTELEAGFQEVVYGINQPAAARNFQSVFWNISYFDKYYFEKIFEDFIFPDGDEPLYSSVSKLQKFFMEWFRDEKRKVVKYELTFPVENGNALTDGKSDLMDKDFKELVADIWSTGHSFFLYSSDSIDSISSCCRLRNGIETKGFSSSLGAGGIATGSKGVITININRLVQDAVANLDKNWNEKTKNSILEAIRKLTIDVHKYLIAWNELLYDLYDQNLLPVYLSNFIKLEDQYLTIGVNGFLEGAEFLQIDPKSKAYLEYAKTILEEIKTINANCRSYVTPIGKVRSVMFNTEFVPAENLGVKHAKWDSEDGYFVPRECYNSYFYPVEDESYNIVDKMKLHGRDFVNCLDGGSAFHYNLEEVLTKEQYLKIIEMAVVLGVNNIVINVPSTICNDCKQRFKNKYNNCPCCGGTNLDYSTRIIGYEKRVSKWSLQRKKEFENRYFEKKVPHLL